MKTQFSRSSSIEYRPIFRATDLKGIGRKSSHMHVLLAFQQVAECTVERFVEAPNGWMLLASIPGRPNTGGIYLYDDRSKGIYWLSVAGRDEDFSAADFDNLLQMPAAEMHHKAVSTNLHKSEKLAFVSHRNRHQRGRGRGHSRSQHPQNGQGTVHPAVLQQAQTNIATIRDIAIN